MADTLTPRERSARMARVRGSGNKETELRLIEVFRRHRISGWRRKFKIFGRPDFVFPRLRVAVFVDGCFWHGCPQHRRIPKSKRRWWSEKIERNKARDRVVRRTLRAKGWVVFRIWEHELARRKEARLVQRIEGALHSV